MLRKYGIFIVLIVIYLLFLVKDNLFSLESKNTLIDTYNEIKSSYYEEEYKEILNLLKIDQVKSSFIYSKVVVRDIYEFFDKVTILKGNNDNIKEGNLVINHLGLVGVINKTQNNISEVSLLTNNKTNLSVKIGDSYGILKSRNNKLYVDNIKINTNINIGDKVYTSGLTKNLEGILIGEVTNIKKDDLELQYIIEVNPAVNFYNIKYVGVIIS